MTFTLNAHKRAGNTFRPKHTNIRFARTLFIYAHVCGIPLSLKQTRTIHIALPSFCIITRNYVKICYIFLRKTFIPARMTMLPETDNGMVALVCGLLCSRKKQPVPILHFCTVCVFNLKSATSILAPSEMQNVRAGHVTVTLLESCCTRVFKTALCAGSFRVSNSREREKKVCIFYKAIGLPLSHRLALYYTCWFVKEKWLLLLGRKWEAMLLTHKKTPSAQCCHLLLISSIQRTLGIAHRKTR